MAGFINNINLYNSEICRLCGEENSNGSNIFDQNNEENNFYLVSLINNYLPIKIQDDQRYPRWICPGCHLQVESTAQFFELLLSGQEKLRQILKNEDLEQKKQQRIDGKSQSLLRSELRNNTQEYVEDSVIAADQPLYSSEHELSVKIDGLDKPRRKRGRPPKPPPEVLEAQRLEQEEIQKNIDSIKCEPNLEINEIDDTNENGLRKKRRIKIPSRYQEAVQGKELERIYVEKGVIDKVEGSDTDEFHIDDMNNPERNEIIGHLRKTDGTNMGDLVLVKSPKRGKKKHNRKGKTKFICDICNKEFFQELKFMAHRLSHQNVRFECTECLEQYADRKALSDHQLDTTHQGEGLVESLNEPDYNEEKYSNQIASMNLSSEPADSNNDDLTTNSPNVTETNHNSNKIDNNEFTIDSSTAEEFIMFKNNNKTNDNLEAIKTNNKDHIIKNEKVKGNEKQGEENENDSNKINNNGDSKMQCDICLRVFNHYGSLIYHKESQHNKEREFICSKCDKSFNHRLLLNRHQRVHSEDRPYECHMCTAKFKTPINLKNHYIKHSGEKNFKCDICEQHFTHRNSLVTHLRLHSGEKPYKCNVCNKTFSQNGNLQEHMRIHTGERPFKCTYCDKMFTTSSQCKNHIKKHLGDRPYCCEICGKKFLYLEFYKTHMRRHNGEKPYVCHICTRGFADNWGLKKHIRFHTGEKPYPCVYCGKKFADCSNLKKHKVNNCVFRFSGKCIDSKEKGARLRMLKQQKDTNVNMNFEDEDPDDEKNKQHIVYLTYQKTSSEENEMQQIQNDRDLSQIKIINDSVNEEDEILSSRTFISELGIKSTNGTILNNFVNTDGSDAMIITVSNKPTNSDDDGNGNVLQLTQNGNELLYHIEPSTDSVNAVGFSDNIQFEYVTDDGRKVRLLSCNDPIDLGSQFIVA